MDTNYHDQLPDEDKLNFLFERLIAAKKYDECEVLCKNILEKNSNSSIAFKALGNINFEQNNIQQALQFYEKSIEANQNNVESVEKLFQLYSTFLQQDKLNNLLCRVYRTTNLNFGYFLPELETAAATEFNKIYQEYFLRIIFKEIKSIFVELVYSPIWSGSPGTITEWKNSSIRSPRFEWLLRNCQNVIPEFYSFLNDKLQEFDSSIPMKETFRLLNKGLLDVTKRLNGNFISLGKKKMESELSFEIWENNLKGRDEEELLLKFNEFIQTENIYSVLLHGSLADGKTEKGYSDFDVTFILNIPKDPSKDELFSIAEAVVKSNHFLLAYNPFMHHGPLLNFIDELNWATEASFPSVLVRNGIWMKNSIKHVSYIDDGLDFILSFSPFDNFFANNFQQPEDFHNPFDLIWWSSSVMFLPLLLTQMLDKKSIWKRDLLTKKNDLIPAKYWELLEEISSIRKKVAQLIQKKVSLPSTVLISDENPGIILNRFKEKFPLDLAEIQSVGITNKLINTTKEFWLFCKNAVFYYNFINQHSSNSSLNIFLNNWANDITEIPVPSTFDIYQETKEYFLKLCETIPQIISVYEFGNVGSPGLSDLDLLVIFDDELSGIPSQLTINSMQQKYAEVFNHNPIFISESSLPMFGAIFPLFNCKRIFGKEQIIKLTTEFDTLVQLSLFTFINVLKYPRDIIYLSKQNKLRWKTLLTYLNSFNHVAKAFELLNITVPLSIQKCLQLNDYIRTNFQENKMSIDDLKDALLLMLEGSTDMILVFDKIWAEAIPELKDIYGTVEKNKYFKQVLNSLTSKTTTYPKLPPILNVVMLHLQKIDDKINIPSSVFEKIEKAFSEYIRYKNNFIQNELVHRRNIDHYIIGNAFSTLPDQAEQKDYSLANIKELESPQFEWFMFKLNAFAYEHSLRMMINWSKIWEYPWIWFNALHNIDFDGKTAVDLGSELSPIPWLLAMKGANVVLIETDEQYISDWRRLNKELNLNVEWRIVSDEKIPLPNNSADILTSFSVLEHQPDKNGAVEEVIRILKPNGVFALSFDICETNMGMTFPEWNGKAIDLQDFETILWTNPAFQKSFKPEWNINDITSFWQWHLQSAEHHNYVTAAAIFYNKKIELKNEEAKNIVWVRIDSIGDNILASSILPHIKQKFSNSKTTVICQEHISELYESSPYVDNIIPLDKKKYEEDNDYRREFINKLNELDPDYVLNSVFSREEIGDEIVENIDSKVKIGFFGDTNNISEEQRETNNKFYTHLIPNDNSDYPIELNLHKQFLNYLNIEVEALKPVVWITDEDREFANHLMQQYDIEQNKFLVLFAGAQSFAKSFYDFGKAIKSFVEENSLSVIALGDNKDFNVNQINLDELNVSTVNLSGKTTLRQAIAIVEKASMAVGVDTGLAHVSAAVEIQNVILLGGGHFGRFMPYSNLTSIVALPLNCYRCDWRCKHGSAYCVKDVDYKVIEEAVNQTFSKKSDKARVFIQTIFQPETDREKPKWEFDDDLLSDQNIEIIKVKPEISLKEIELLILGKEYEKAINHLRGLLNFNPDDINVLNNLAVVQILTKRWENASQTLIAVLKIDPENQVAIENVQYLEKQLVYHKAILDSEELIKQHNFEDAKKILREILNHEPNHIDALNNLAVVEISKNNLAEANLVLEKILNLDPENSVALNNKNVLWELIGQDTSPGQVIKIVDSNYPKISIITPSFNQGKYIEKTIQSVFEQNYPNLEYIIIDGGSTDNTVEIIKKYQDKIDYWVSEKDDGQADAINKGIKKATGEIIAWLNSDDFYYPDALHGIAEAYLKYPDAGLYTGNGYKVDRSGNNPRLYANSVGFDYNALLNGSCFILQPSTFINRKAVDKLGLLDDSLRYGLDLEYWLRIGKEFDVIVINKPLSAYRWYDEIKTNEGFKRWIELWQIYKRYTDAEITPGLLVEFFSILKKDFVRKDLEIDVKDLAAKGFEYTYLLMQQALNLKDCIPEGRGIICTPTLKDKSSNHIKPKQISVVKDLNTKPKIDVVLQATGVHAWGVGRGWENGANKLGLHHRTFAPGASWGAKDVDCDDGLYDYLLKPEADVMILLGFDWHSQMLHLNPKWKDRWLKTSIYKVLYVQESVENHCKLFNTLNMKSSLISAAEIADFIVYTDLNDTEFIKSLGKPYLLQPFGVDDTVFNIKKDLTSRKNRAFFRGKIVPFNNDNAYAERRTLLKYLLDNDLIDLIEYSNQPVTAGEIARDFNQYTTAVNLPSVFANHPTRVYEALACGCALITNKTNIPKVDSLFEDGVHLIYYSDKTSLQKSIGLLQGDKKLLNDLSKNGYEYVLDNFTLDKHLNEIISYSKNRISLSEQETKIDIPAKRDKTKILIDGVIFQLQKNRPHGIYRVWEALLREFSKTDLADRILLLDRELSAPDIPNIQTKVIHSYTYAQCNADSHYLQDICDEEKASLFISTYYTYPDRTHNVLLLHDMIPEAMGWDLSNEHWSTKIKALLKANAYFSVSNSTKNDFIKYYPKLSNKKIFVVNNAADHHFRKNSLPEIENFKIKKGLKKPYFIVSGNRDKYKNAILFFKAFSKLRNKKSFQVLITGGSENIEEEFLPYLKGINYQLVRLDDKELSLAYNGAVALVYPSKHEGFGLPILEAMQSGCPVITCKNSSISEVANNAAIYVNENDVNEMKQVLIKVQKQDVRNSFINKGLKNALRFSWKKSAAEYKKYLYRLLREFKNKKLNPSTPLDEYNKLYYLIMKDERLGVAHSKLIDLLIDGIKADPAEFYKIEKELVRLEQFDFYHLLKSLNKKNKKDPFYCYVEGLIYQKNNDYHNALALYMDSLNAGWTHWRIGYLAALAAIDDNNLDVAKQLLETVIKAKPDYRDAVDKLQFVVDIMSGKIKPNKIKVSAIVSTYNSEKFIRGCLDDLINQTLYKKGELEIIVVNSGSNENESRIVQEYQTKFSNLELISTDERETVYKAWNRGIKAATGKYITNANTDDRHRHDALEILTLELDKNNDVALVYADSKVTQTENRTFDNTPLSGYLLYPEFDRQKLFEICFIGPQPMWRKSLHEKYGYFDEKFKSAGDSEFWLRIVSKEKFKHINQLLGLYLLSMDSIENSDRKTSQKESEIARERYWKGKRKRPLPAGAYFIPYKESKLQVKEPLFSVVVPTFNRPDYLPKALDSLSNQVFKNFEVIVVNDGKTDESYIVDKYEGKIYIRYLHHIVNRERSASRNDAIKIARGKYLAFLDDDDIYYPDHLQLLAENMDEQYDIFYTDAVRAVYEKTGNKYKLKDKYVLYSIEYDRNKLLIGNIAPINCFAVSKSIAFKAGLFDETINVLEDWEFLIRLSKFSNFKHIKQNTVEVTWKDDETTTTSKMRDEFSITRKKIYQKYEKEIAEIPNKDEIISEFNSIWRNDFSINKVIVSIIIPTINQVEFTRQCIESIEKFTDVEYEIIVVDNASTDNTIEEVRKYSNVKIIRNSENRGFPKAINQGIKAAKGKYILIANNDIVVTEGWLNRMIEIAKGDDSIGLVGPISNSVSWYQIDKDAKYNTLEEMHTYAEKVKEKNKNKTEEFPRIAFLCALIKREVTDKIGGLDERFSPGNYEDDDFCLRAQLAGYKTVIAKDVFIHHFGSKSFTNEGKDKYLQLLGRNKEIFVEKWGADPEQIWLKGEKPKSVDIVYPLHENKFTKSFRRATKNINEKDFKSASANLKIAIENYEESANNELIEYSTLLNLAGNIALYNNDLQSAKNFFEDELNYKPDSATACFGLAELLFLDENYKAAKIMFEYAVKNDPDYELAISGLRKTNRLLQLPPDDNTLQVNDGQNSLEKVEKLLKEARKNFESKNFSDALKLVTEAEKLIENGSLNGQEQELLVPLNNFKGYCYVGLNKLDDAKSCFENALKTEPNSSDACAGLAEADYLSGNDQEAKVMFEWAVKNDSDNLFAVERLKKVNLHLGYEEAHNSLLVEQ
ncbi:hyaluronan synthase [bacterium BMS3Abin03]|nr:hyaluronan synthase [bacterium BMS3Abin03]